jgi:hypothetical protein
MLADDIRMNLDFGQFVTIDKTKEDQVVQFVERNKIFDNNKMGSVWMCILEKLIRFFIPLFREFNPLSH